LFPRSSGTLPRVVSLRFFRPAAAWYIPVTDVLTTAASLSPQILDIILLVRDKIRQFSSSAYATRELKKVFLKFDPDGNSSISW
jgi:hypothetical protein